MNTLMRTLQRFLHVKLIQTKLHVKLREQMEFVGTNSLILQHVGVVLLELQKQEMLLLLLVVVSVLPFLLVINLHLMLVPDVQFTLQIKQTAHILLVQLENMSTKLSHAATGLLLL
jgi:hypothetical protein